MNTTTDALAQEFLSERSLKTDVYIEYTIWNIRMQVGIISR